VCRDRSDCEFECLAPGDVASAVGVGPGADLAVKIDTSSVEEQAFNTALHPRRAKVTVEIKVSLTTTTMLASRM
jgi:hypothetical protein